MTRPRSRRRVLPRTLIGRSVIILVTPLIVVQVVVTWAFYDRHWNIITKRLVTSVAGEVAMTIEGMRLFPGMENERRILLAAREARLHATFERGARLTGPEPEIGDRLVERRLFHALRNSVDRPFHMRIAGVGTWVRIKIQLDYGVLDIYVPAGRLFTSTNYLFIGWMVGTSLVMLVIAGLFMRNQVRPIRHLAAAVDDFGKGRDVGEIRPSGASEIRTLASAFEIMRERIRRMIVQRTDILAGVSHDLRTPLTRIRLQIAMMGGGREVAALESDIAEMEELVEEYLAFVAAEGVETADDADLLPILDEAAQGARRAGAEVTVVARPDLVAAVRPIAFRRCLANVMGNAARHARHIAVRAFRTADGIEIVIDDDGPGIPVHAREVVFKPFFQLGDRSDPARGGTGLGLTIARDIMRGHGGDIRIESAPLGGVRARLSVPS